MGQLPGTSGLLFLLYLLFVLPWAALRSARRVREVERAGGTIPGDAVWVGTIVSLVALFALSWLVSRGWDFAIFAVPRLGAREWGASVAALAVCFGVRAVARVTRSAEERRKLFVYRIAPRTPRAWALWAVTVLCAAVAEETAYRGVGMSILWFWLGSPWAPALLCALAFALAHAVQGQRSGVLVFVIALVMHALVLFTGTLVLAMVVHAIYDLAAGSWIAREAAAMPQAEGSSP